MNRAERSAVAGAIGTDEYVLAARGTTALWAALKVLAPQRSHVLVPANVCEVVVAAILHAGLRPRYTDVHPIDDNMTIGDLDAAYTSGCGALVAVHNFGTPLPMRDIIPWCHRRNVAVIEDCCNALGATYDGRPVGTFGDAAIYSFGKAKMLDLGYGGLLGAHDASLVRQGRQLIQALPVWGDRQRGHDHAMQQCVQTIRRHPTLHDPRLHDPRLYRALYRTYEPALFAAAPDDLGDRVAAALHRLPAQLEQRRCRAGRYRRLLTHDDISHRSETEGEVCWRYTFHVPPDARDQIVENARQRRLPISTWFPAVDRLFGHRRHDVDLPGVDQFESTVINLFVSSDTKDATKNGTVDVVTDATVDAAIGAVLSNLSTKSPLECCA